MTRPSDTRATILVVEDHDDLSEALEVNFRRDGYDVRRARDGRDAILAWRASPIDLMVLDLGLPRVDGLTVLEQLRAEGQWFPVLILSARGAPDDRVEGFRRGADDYVTKPFHTLELLSRVRALLRRAAAPVTADRNDVVADHGITSVGFTDEEMVSRFGFTSRQAAVARRIAEGLSNPEIAMLLGISRFTVRNHAEQVMDKLAVASRGRVGVALRAAYDADRRASA